MRKLGHLGGPSTKNVNHCQDSHWGKCDCDFRLCKCFFKPICKVNRAREQVQQLQHIKLNPQLFGHWDKYYKQIRIFFYIFSIFNYTQRKAAAASTGAALFQHLYKDNVWNCSQLVCNLWTVKLWRCKDQVQYTVLSW